MIISKDIDNVKAFDWGQISKYDTKCRDIYPELFFQKIIELGICLSGQSENQIMDDIILF